MAVTFTPRITWKERAKSQPLRAVDEHGEVKRTSDGSSDQIKADLLERTADRTGVGARLADVEARISMHAGMVADLTKQIADLDATRAIETPSAGNLRTASAINAQAAGIPRGSRQAPHGR